MSKLVFVLPPAAVAIMALAGALVGQQQSAKELYVVTHVDFVPPNVADMAKEMAQFGVDSRKDAGNVRFEVLRSVERMNHFEFVEVWRTRQDFEAHLAQEHTRRFREKIQPNLGSPFDERLYNVLE